MNYVLIVDDSKVARMLIAQGLAASFNELEIVEAASGAEAIERIAELGCPPEFSIVDYNMPGMTGLEFATWLGEHHPSVPSALCTANIQDGLARRAAEAGIPILPKPFTLAKLREVLELPL